MNNQRQFLDTVAMELRLRTVCAHRTTFYKLIYLKWEDWYKIGRKEILEKGGRGLFNHYASVGEAVQAIYPDRPWQSSLFVENLMVPRGFWQSDKNIREALDRAEQKLGIQKVLECL